MGRSKILKNRWRDTQKVIRLVQEKFRQEGYDTQLLMDFGDEYVLQVRDSTVSDTAGPVKWLCSATGSAAVATLVARRVASGCDVEIEAVGGKWLDKAAVMGVSMVVLWPLFVTSSIGMFRQNKLIGRLYDEMITEYLTV